GKFAEAVAIAESTLPPFQRVCLYINTKSGILNNLLTGITPTISKVGYTKNPTGFRMMVSGLSEIEIDLSTLTEKSIGNFFSVNNDSVTDFGVWEQGYYQRLANPNGMEYIKVYQKDTVGTSLLYSIPIKIKAKEQLAGIVPTRKGYITYAPSTEAISKNTIEIYDSAANKIQSISTHYPLQTLNNASKEQKLFSKNGLYMMLKESIIATAGIDSCRLRIFEVQSFKTIFDESYIEHVGVNFWQRQTAYFTDSSNGFYIVKAKRGTSDIANYLHYYNLQNGKFVFKNKTQLCLDNSCKIIANVRQLRVNNYNTVMLWFGDVADNPISKVPGYQFVILTDVKTGKHISGLNMPLFPALLNVLQYKDYFLLQFTDHIKVVQPTPNFTNHFLTIVPQINEGLGELNTLFFNENTATNKFWYYEKSNSDESITFRIGNSSFRRKQFDIAFNRPDMILSAIPGHDSTYLQQYKKAIIKRNERIKNVLQDFRLENLPVVTLNENATKFVRDNVFTIAIDVATKLPLQKFIITVNGNRQERNASTVPNRKNNLHTFFIEEKLSNGFNNIEISAVTESNFESLPLRLTQDYFGNTQKPNLHVLAISVGAYKNGLSNLPYAVKDGRDVAQLFNTYRKDTLYKQIFIDTLFNDAATMEATILWLKSLQNLSPNDHVLIFYSGHGFLDSNYNLQLATTGFLKQRNQIKTIEYEALIQIIDALPARQKLLLIDACQSGDFDRNITDSSDFVNNKYLPTDSLYTPKGIKLPTQRLQQENSFEQMQQLFSFSEMGNGTVVISAAGGTQSAFENNKYKNGYFTYALKEALLEYKAAPSYELNKIITLNQLVKYLKKRVAELTNGRQIPNLRINNPDLNWRVR
ncbi:MAG: caspase family protein, partial [Ferruginibacter sp.]